VPRLVVILGPTATGKSDLAMAVARALDGEIVNGDALQAYRGLDLGTAKPTPLDRRTVRHHLVDILDPSESYSAGEFARLGRRAIEGIRERRKLALVVGGSGLYLRALLEGLSPIPEIPVEVRQRLQHQLSVGGLEPLRDELRRVDPETEARLASGDRQRILRALEVWQATSRPLSSWLRKRPEGEPLQAMKIGLTLSRGLLYDRISERVEKMVQEGWVEEVRGLLATGLTGGEPAFQAIGYREIVRHVMLGTPLTEIIEEIIVATRRYAKRQLTWFRRERDVSWYVAGGEEVLARTVIADLTDTLRSAEES
jgi:tRNA dimethylallyltransferase